MQPLAASNARVKEARKLSRRSVRAERRLFLADGPKAVQGALAVDGCVVEVFATPDAAQRHGEMLGSAPITLVDERAMAGLSDSVSPAGVVAICRFIDVEFDELIDAVPADGVLAVCADVRDPGNAGTIIRTADASGAAGVVLAGNSVDPYNDKTVRATVGSLFHLPITVQPDPLGAVRRLQAAGFTVLAADGGGETGVYALPDPLSGSRVAWLFGNEAWGLPEALAAAADHRVRIPILGSAESLNLSTAAAICLYESTRQRLG